MLSYPSSGLTSVVGASAGPIMDRGPPTASPITTQKGISRPPAARAASFLEFLMPDCSQPFGKCGPLTAVQKPV